MNGDTPNPNPKGDTVKTPDLVYPKWTISKSWWLDEIQYHSTHKWN